MALALGHLGNDNLKDRVSCGADLVLLRGFEFGENFLLDSGPDPVRLRVRDTGWGGGTKGTGWDDRTDDTGCGGTEDTGWDGGTEDISGLAWDGASTGAIP
jgi:hypothetical protein